MLIYVKHFAQMCNRLWALVPVLAYAIHRQQRVYVLFAKKEYVDCFPLLKNNKYIKFLFSHNSSIPLALEWRLALYSERAGLELKGDLSKAVQTRGFVFVDGWQHSNDISFVLDHRDEIVKLFQPGADVTQKVEPLFKDYHGLTIGVHVRRGDYQNYLGGKYCYADNVYLNVINEMRRIFSAEGARVRFLICSNEKHGILNDSDDIFSIQNTDGITDLYALSFCDYIIGPPSSYSQWASFCGGVPLYVMLDKNSQIHVDSFSRIVSFNKFENGRTLCFNEQVGEYFIS